MNGKTSPFKMTLILLTVFLCSCVENYQIEKIGIINAQGLDALKNDLLESTLIIYQFSSESNSITKTRSGIGYTVKGTIEDTEHNTSFKLVPGKVRLDMYGREIAEKGIMPYLDTIIRDAQMSDVMYLTISDTTAKEILSTDTKKISKDVGQFLFELIENESKSHTVHRKNLQDFLRIYYEIGQDNVLPIFELHEGVPRQKSIGVLKDGQLVGEIGNDESLLINLVNSKIKRHLMEFRLPLSPFTGYLDKRIRQHQHEILHTAFRIETSHSKNKLIDEQNLTFQTDIKIKMRLLEQSEGIIIRNNHVLQLLEREVENNIQSKLETLLSKLQDFNSDPFGYGRYYRIHQKDDELSKEQWREMFPDIKVNFNIDVDIMRYGIIE